MFQCASTYIRAYIVLHRYPLAKMRASSPCITLKKNTYSHILKLLKVHTDYIHILDFKVNRNV